jgi:hypothetical protein
MKVSNSLIGGLAVLAVMLGALPAAQGIDAATKDSPTLQINRTAKGDRLGYKNGITAKETPSEAARETPDQSGRRRIMDGCDPMFSPVTVPGMAHVAGRCVG